MAELLCLKISAAALLAPPHAPTGHHLHAVSYVALCIVFKLSIFTTMKEEEEEEEEEEKEEEEEEKEKNNTKLILYLRAAEPLCERYAAMASHTSTIITASGLPSGAGGGGGADDNAGAIGGEQMVGGAHSPLSGPPSLSLLTASGSGGLTGAAGEEAAVSMCRRHLALFSVPASGDDPGTHLAWLAKQHRVRRKHVSRAPTTVELRWLVHGCCARQEAPKVRASLFIASVTSAQQPLQMCHY